MLQALQEFLQALQEFPGPGLPGIPGQKGPTVKQPPVVDDPHQGVAPDAMAVGQEGLGEEVAFAEV